MPSDRAAVQASRATRRPSAMDGSPPESPAAPPRQAVCSSFHTAPGSRVSKPAARPPSGRPAVGLSCRRRRRRLSATRPDEGGRGASLSPARPWRKRPESGDRRGLRQRHQPATVSHRGTNLSSECAWRRRPSDGGGSGGPMMVG